MNKQKIPKVIHYCWFGGNPLPELAIKCIESWKKYCPDYEIKEWNENNFDINCCAYVKEAYEMKKWAFVSDVARLYALVNVGGVYMDTDVEVLKPLDNLLEYEAFSGFESETQIPTGLMACTKGHGMFEEFLEEYNMIHFIRNDGSMDLTTNVTRITKTCMKYGLKKNNTLQTINGFTLLPKDYLCPKDLETKEIYLTENSYAIHHFDGSWKTEDDICAANLSKKLSKIFPKRIAGYLGKFISIVKYYGLIKAIKHIIGWIKRRS